MVRDKPLGHLLEDDQPLLDNLYTLGVADDFLLLFDNNLGF